MTAPLPPGPPGHWLLGNLLEFRRDLLGLVPDHHDGFLRTQRRARSQHLLHQRPSSGLVQHLREIRLQPRAFARSQHHNRQIFVCHD